MIDKTINIESEIQITNVCPYCECGCGRCNNKGKIEFSIEYWDLLEQIYDDIAKKISSGNDYSSCGSFANAMMSHCNNRRTMADALAGEIWIKFVYKLEESGYDFIDALTGNRDFIDKLLERIGERMNPDDDSTHIVG